MATTLRHIVESVRDRQRTLTYYGPNPPDGLCDLFATRNVRIEHREMPAGTTDGFLVVRGEDGFRGSVSATAVNELLAPDPNGIGREVDSERDFEALLGMLSETAFRSADRRQLLATSREIEDRAFRHADGTLRAGFQTADPLAAQADVYERLGQQSDLRVHVYAAAETDPRPIPEVTLHAETAPEIGDWWFVVYDGGCDDDAKCAMLAAERRGGEYDGVWTYDPALVDDLVAYLRDTYD